MIRRGRRIFGRVIVKYGTAGYLVYQGCCTAW